MIMHLIFTFDTYVLFDIDMHLISTLDESEMHRWMEIIYNLLLLVLVLKVIDI